MTQVFGTAYADSYDALYGEKDYLAECAMLTRLFDKYGDGKVKSVLDLGCGTGNHALPLARQGFEVVGVERSPDMLARARAKAAQAAPVKVTFHPGDIREADLGRQFDAALMMFAVLGYQTGNADVRAALGTARRHLRKGGLFIFDVWYGPAVLRERPSQRCKVIPTADGQILRVASGTIDSRRHLCTVDYHLWQIGKGKAVGEGRESHQMRYFFPQELDLFLGLEGLTPVRLGAFPHFEQDPDDTTWNVVGVARA